MKCRFVEVASLLLLTAGCVGLSRVGAQSAVLASTTSAAAQVRSGAEIFHECLNCHSKQDGIQRAPRIDGLPAWYVEQQLNKFKQGIRGGDPENKSEALMASIFQGTPLLKNDAEFNVVAEYVASLTPLSHPKVVRGNAALGKLAYPSCVPCHGDRAQGNPALKAPPLDVQEDGYLLQWLQLIKNGDRGNHADDIEAKLMRAAIGGVEVTNFPHIVRYIADELARTNATISPPVKPAQP